MQPSSAKDSAAGSTSVTFAQESAGTCGSGSDCGMPPKRVPMVSTGMPSIAAAIAATRDRDDEARPMRAVAAHGEDAGDRENGNSYRRDVGRRQRLHDRAELGDDRTRFVVELEAEQLLDLAGEDDDGDACGEARRSRETGCI